MNQNPQFILLQVLDIIGYIDNKEDFTNKFFQLCKQQAIVDLVKSLPSDKQTALESNSSLLKEYFSEEQMADALEKATRETFQSYLQEIIPTLNDKQKSELEIYLKSLPEEYSPPA